jgi:predicted cobalt transporter CbtA
VKHYLRRGVVAGLAAGAALAIVLRVLGEGTIGAAIAIERARQPVHHDMFSRGTQQVGGMAAALLYGVAMGAVFAVVFATVRHRLAATSDWRRAVSLALVGLVTLAVVPMAKYPANPPAVGDPSTIGRRTALYVVLVACSVLASFSAWHAFRWLRARGLREHTRVPLALWIYVVIVAVVFVVLPGNPDAVTAPATLVWRFRVESLAGAAAYWGVVGLTFGWLCERDGAGSRRVTARAAARI